MSALRPRIDYYFSFVSLWSYIGSAAFRQLVQRHNVEVVYKPIDLHAIFKAGGGLPVTQRAPQRQAYRFVEMKRWRDLRNVPLVLKPKHHPSDPHVGHKMLLAALAQGLDVSDFVHEALQILWVHNENVEDPAVVVAAANRAGLNGKSLLSASAAPAWQTQVDALTAEAVQRQVFGTPLYFYRDEPFWGQDRLDLLEQAILSGRDPVPFAPL